MTGTENNANELADFSPEELALVEADRSGTVEQPEAKPEQIEQPEAEVRQEVQEVAQEQKEVKPPEGFVPHGALHEERARRKEIQAKNQELTEKAIRLEERLKALTEGRKEPELTYDDDPLGYSRREIDRVRERVEGLDKQYPNQLNELKGEIEALRMQRAIEKQEMVFEKENPDYRDALNFYAKTRGEALEDAGFERDEALENVQQELQGVITRSLQSGKNPAEAVYKMASKIGFKSQKQDSKNDSKLESLKKAETATKSLSENSGKAKTELSAESIAEMSDEDFMKISDEQFRKAMGG